MRVEKDFSIDRIIRKMKAMNHYLKENVWNNEELLFEIENCSKNIIDLDNFSSSEEFSDNDKFTQNGKPSSTIFKASLSQKSTKMIELEGKLLCHNQNHTKNSQSIAVKKQPAEAIWNKSWI